MTKIPTAADLAREFDDILLKAYAPSGTRFAYVVVVTELPAAPGGCSMIHVTHNGYGAPGSQLAADQAAGVLRDAAGILRASVVRK